MKATTVKLNNEIRIHFFTKSVISKRFFLQRYLFPENNNVAKKHELTANSYDLNHKSTVPEINPDQKNTFP